MEYIEEINEYFDHELRTMDDYITKPINEFLDEFNENMQRRVKKKRQFIRNYKKNPWNCTAEESYQILKKYAFSVYCKRQRYYKQDIVITDIDELPIHTSTAIKTMHAYNQNNKDRFKW